MTEKAGFSNLTIPMQALIGLLTILAIVIPPTASLILFDTRIKSNKETITRHEETISENEDSIHKLELSNAVIETRFNQIMAKLESVDHKLDTWEPMGE